VEDGGGCQATQQVILVNSNAITISLVAAVNPSCGISDGTIEVSSTGTGTEDYFIDFVNSGATTLFTGLGPASYELSVTENGCSDTITVILSNSSGPTITSAVATDITCFGANDGTITITSAGGLAPIDYQIDDGVIIQNNATGVFTNLTPGTCDITVTDGSGCQSVTQLIITEPSAITFTEVVTDILCFGEINGEIAFTNVLGGTPTLLYSIDGGLTTSTSLVFSSLPAGPYSMLIIDNNLCSSALLQVNISEPALFGGNSVTVDVSCFGACDGEVQINAFGGTAPYTFVWNFGIPGNQAGLATNVCHGTYTVDIIDARGCVTSVGYVIDQPANIVFQTIDVVYAGCEPGECSGSINTTATGATNFIVGGIGSVAGSFSNLCSGSYTLIAENALGCQTSAIVQINNEIPPASDFGIIPGEMSLPDHSFSTFNQSSNATSYEWTIVGEDFTYVTTDPNFDLTLPYTGDTYSVCLVAFNETSCTDTLCDFINVRDEFTLWVPNTFTPDGDELNNIFEPVISDVDVQSYDFLIFNRWGQLIFESHDATIGWDGTYNGKLVQDGIYVWKITLKSKFSDELREYHGHVNIMR
jgi:gliding motility-associated-like protein